MLALHVIKYDLHELVKRVLLKMYSFNKQILLSFMYIMLIYIVAGAITCAYYKESHLRHIYQQTALWLVRSIERQVRNEASATTVQNATYFCE